MPRKKRPEVLPMSTHEITYDGDTYLVEVWEKYPNERKRGAHRRKIKSQVFDAALKRLADRYYFSNSPIEKEITRRRLYDERFNSELVSEIKKICIASNIKAGRSTLYEVATGIKIAIKALDNGIASKEATAAPGRVY